MSDKQVVTNMYFLVEIIIEKGLYWSLTNTSTSSNSITISNKVIMIQLSRKQNNINVKQVYALTTDKKMKLWIKFGEIKEVSC